MRELLEKIFGKEVSEDEEIYQFYKDTHEGATKEYSRRHLNNRIANLSKKVIKSLSLEAVPVKEVWYGLKPKDGNDYNRKYWVSGFNAALRILKEKEDD